jgi:hypothetical protein
MAKTKLSNIDRSDITSKGKYTFFRKSKKKNISVPLDPKTITEVEELCVKFEISKCEMLRNMIEFSCKNEQFKRLMEQMK